MSKVALWGRSMGAATAVLYAQRDPSVAALVLDSAFSRCVPRLSLHNTIPTPQIPVSCLSSRKLNVGLETWL